MCTATLPCWPCLATCRRPAPQSCSNRQAPGGGLLVHCTLFRMLHMLLAVLACLATPRCSTGGLLQRIPRPRHPVHVLRMAGSRCWHCSAFLVSCAGSAALPPHAHHHPPPPFLTAGAGCLRQDANRRGAAQRPVLHAAHPHLWARQRPGGECATLGDTLQSVMAQPAADLHSGCLVCYAQPKSSPSCCVCFARAWPVPPQAAQAAWEDARATGVDRDLILYSAMIDCCAKVRA